MGGAAHVLLHIAHPGGALEVKTTGVEHHPLADQGHQRPVRLVQVPADLEHARRAMRGGGAADGMDRRIVILQQGVAGRDGQARARALGDLARDGLELQRPHVGGRGVDHLARQGAGGGDVQRRRQVEAVRRDQTRAAALGPGLVAVEQIAAERKGQGRRIRRLALDALQSPVAGGQARRQSARGHGVEGLARAEQGQLRRAVGAGDDQQLARLSGEAVGLGPGGDASLQRRARLDDADRARGLGGGDQQFGLRGHGATFPTLNAD